MACLLLTLVLLSAADTAGAREEPAEAVATEELFAQARAALAEGDYSVAQERYEEILRRDRTNLTAILELSNACERSGKLEYARGLLIRATRIDPHYPAIQKRRRSVDAKLATALAAEVDSLLQRGDCDAAVAKLSLHNAIDPGNPSVHYKRALCMFEMGRYDAALSDIDVAIAASPQEPYFLLRDRIHGEIERSEIKALAARARQLVTSDHPRHREEALELLTRILERDPEHTWARAEFDRLSQTDPAVDGNDAGTDAIRGEAAWKTAWTVARSAGDFVGRHFVAVVALVISVLLFRSPLSRALLRRLARPPLLSGDLGRFSVAEVLTMLNAEPHTGVLEIRATSCRGRVYLRSGEPRHCVAGKLRGVDALMALIEKAERGRFTFTRGSVPAEGTIDTPLSILLVEQAHQASGVNLRPGVVKKSRMKELLDSRLEV